MKLNFWDYKATAFAIFIALQTRFPVFFSLSGLIIILWAKGKEQVRLLSLVIKESKSSFFS